MRKFKKIISVCMVATMMMSILTGCRAAKNEQTQEETTQTTEATSEASEENSEESTETTSAEQTEEQTEEELGVSTGDIAINLTFDEDVNGVAKYINGGNAETASTNGELDVDIKSMGSLDYANQIYYDGFRLYQDCVYEYSFDIRCDIERKIEWRFQINGGDYHAYASEVVDIGPETKHVTGEFTMNETSDPAPRLCFNMGRQEGMTGSEPEHHIYIDNVKLEVVDASKAQKIEALPEPLGVNLNQVGYKTADTKIATISSREASSFDVIDVSTGKSVYNGTLGDAKYESSADVGYKLADFSSVTAEGTYKLVTNEGAESFEFDIRDSVYDDMFDDVVLMLYNQRCGTALDAAVSGVFAHEACHTGSAIVYGTDMVVEDVSGGWHDAGDYGRYVVPGAKTVADLFLTYEDMNVTSDAMGIPESGNGVPDILDEARYELEWMLKMQDKASGGVYHKVTCEVFPEAVMPEEETDQLILCPISNAATGDFAAVMAKASRIYAESDADFAAVCLEAAENAWAYLEANQDAKGYFNPENIETGEYPDNNLYDEYLWAAVELYCVTGEEKYKTLSDEYIDSNKVRYSLGWADIGYYALYDYIRSGDAPEKVKAILLTGADEITEEVNKNGFGASISTFPWGSNMTIANNGMLLLMADKIAPNESYVEGAKTQLDYLLGRNSVSYCYVTGYGDRYPEHVHHRPSQAKEACVPGMLVGGANNNLEDSYASAVLAEKPPMSCYVDNVQSFSCNEVTIYWNSPLIYLMAAFLTAE